MSFFLSSSVIVKDHHVNHTNLFVESNKQKVYNLAVKASEHGRAYGRLTTPIVALGSSGLTFLGRFGVVGEIIGSGFKNMTKGGELQKKGFKQLKQLPASLLKLAFSPVEFIGRSLLSAGFMLVDPIGISVGSMSSHYNRKEKISQQLMRV